MCVNSSFHDHKQIQTKHQTPNTTHTHQHKTRHWRSDCCWWGRRRRTRRGGGGEQMMSCECGGDLRRKNVEISHEIVIIAFGGNAHQIHASYYTWVIINESNKLWNTLLTWWVIRRQRMTPTSCDAPCTGTQQGRQRGRVQFGGDVNRARGGDSGFGCENTWENNVN